jgi:hypothetical protein
VHPSETTPSQSATRPSRGNSPTQSAETAPAAQASAGTAPIASVSPERLQERLPPEPPLIYLSEIGFTLFPKYSGSFDPFRDDILSAVSSPASSSPAGRFTATQSNQRQTKMSSIGETPPGHQAIGQTHARFDPFADDSSVVPNDRSNRSRLERYFHDPPGVPNLDAEARVISKSD